MSVIEALIILATIGAAITGIVLILHSGGSGSDKVARGIIIAAVGSVIGLVYWSLARAVRLFAAYTSVRVRSDALLIDTVTAERAR